ncbi:MAG TPA: hypothetical protein VJC14_00370 [Candidatus Paceibacterota bacterium]
MDPNTVWEFTQANVGFTVFAGIVLAFALLMIWFMVAVSRRLKRENAEREIRQRDAVRIRLAFAECFKAHGISFGWTTEHGKPVGRTAPMPSGVYILIEQYLDYYGHEYDYMVDLRNDTWAGSTVHSEIDSALMYRDRSTAWHFHRQDLSDLEDVGIDKVTAHYVHVLQSYDKIWPETALFQESLQLSARVFEEGQRKALRGVRAVIDKYVPPPNQAASA